MSACSSRTSPRVDSTATCGRFAWEEYRITAQRYWALFAPLVPDLRKADPSLWKDWERWLIEVRERDRKAGKVEDCSAAAMAVWIPETIAYYIDRLRIQDEIRKGAISTWP